jgi:hypothetical protein
MTDHQPPDESVLLVMLQAQPGLDHGKAIRAKAKRRKVYDVDNRSIGALACRQNVYRQLDFQNRFLRQDELFKDRLKQAFGRMFGTLFRTSKRSKDRPPSPGPGLYSDRKIGLGQVYLFQE